MRLLFVHQNFPGQFLHLLRHLVRQPGHQIVFISEDNPNRMPGVHRMTYAVTPVSNRTHFDARDFDVAMRRAAGVGQAAVRLRDAGFTPDVIVGHEGWGEMLNLGDIWPGQPRLGYREYFYHLEGADVGCDPEFPAPPDMTARIRAKNAAHLLALHQGYPGLSPTAWQRSLYPAWARPAITVVPEGVDLQLCRPDPALREAAFGFGAATVAPGELLVTFVARELEPYRGFHVLMRALPAILAARRDVQVICLGGDGVVYGMPPAGGGTWRQALLRELGAAIDPARVHFPGKVAYADHVRLLQRSDVHAYLSYPFIPSWSLREALACGCAIVAAGTPAIDELVSDGRTGALVPPFDPAALAEQVLALLDSPIDRQRFGKGARAFAEAGLRMDDHIDAFVRLIQSVAG